MDILLDTHTLIWFLNGDKKLSRKVRECIETPSNLKFVSIASIWEIAIKISLNKFRYPKGFNNFLEMVDDNGFDILPISFEHTLTVSSLDFIHKDPFDRLLIAQSICDNLTIATKDSFIEQYNVQTIW